MAAKKKTEVAVAGQFTMDAIPEMLEKVNAQIRAIKGADSDGSRTDFNLTGFGDIRKLKPGELIQAASMVIAKEAAYDNAAKVMGLTKADKYPAFKISNATKDAWLEDITRQYHIVTAKDKLEKLEKAKTELEKHLSEEHKLNALVGNLADILG